MSFRKPVNKKEFAREVFVGVLALACLFAIFLFVALQKSTGRSLSPLAYLWPETFNKEDERIPVVVFRSEEDRQKALEDVPFSNQSLAKKNREEPQGEPVANQKDLRLTSSEKTNQKQSHFPLRKNKTDSGFDSKDYPVAQAGFVDTKKTSRIDESKFKVPDRKTSSKQNTFPSIPPVNQFANQPKPTEFNTKDSSDSKSDSAGLPKAPKIRSDAKVVRATFDQTKKKIEPRKLDHSKPGKDKSIKQKSASPESGSSKPTTHKSPDVQSNERQEIIKNSLRIRPAKDDSFFKISLRFYGDGKYFRQLAEFNDRPNLSDELPNPVLVPTLKDLLKLDGGKQGKTEKVDERNQKTVYLTTGGETLFDIAREKLGNASRYLEIYKLNRSQLPKDCDSQTRLQSGIELSLPQD